MAGFGGPWSTEPMLNPDLNHIQVPSESIAAGAQSGAGAALQSHSARCLWELWENLCKLEDILAQNPIE